MRKLIIALALTTILPAVAVAAAALPQVGVRFTGPTSAKPVNSFGDTVTFVTGSKSIKRVAFGTLGCFGYGTFPYGVDPYATSLAQLMVAVPMTATGTFAVKSAPTRWAGGDDSTKLITTITGKFTSSKKATGVISVIEKGPNGSCGPYKMTFTAIPGGR